MFGGNPGKESLPRMRLDDFWCLQVGYNSLDHINFFLKGSWVQISIIFVCKKVIIFLSIRSDMFLVAQKNLSNCSFEYPQHIHFH